MGFVFHPGWSFDDHFWDALRRFLPTPSHPEKHILVGHSLGFMRGLRQRQKWDAWIAINSFPRFVRTPSEVGCVSAAVLRDMEIKLNANVTKTLKNFYTLIGGQPPQSPPDIDKLRVGLEELRDEDVKETLVALHVPGLVLASRHDPLVPVVVSEALSGLTHRNELVWHEGSGHVLPQSDPAWCAQQINEFLQKHHIL